MRLPLIVAHRPSEDIRCPSVTLRPGRWVIETNHKDSILALSHLPDVAFQNGFEYIISDVTETSVLCKRCGSESSVTVYICLYR
jgi:hypothetical protein